MFKNNIYKIFKYCSLFDFKYEHICDGIGGTLISSKSNHPYYPYLLARTWTSAAWDWLSTARSVNLGRESGTRYNNETPKSILTHLAIEYCKAMITDQLMAESEFAKPWDQVRNLGIWITWLEIQWHKC